YVYIIKCPVGILFPFKVASIPKFIGTNRSVAGCVILFYGIYQSFGNILSFRIVGTLLYLITDTPHNDGGMIAVAAHGSSQILITPFVKELMIVLLTFGLLPLVECFMDNE